MRSVNYESLTAAEAIEALKVVAKQREGRPYFGDSDLHKPEEFKAEDRAYIALLARLEASAKGSVLITAELSSEPKAA